MKKLFYKFVVLTFFFFIFLFCPGNTKAESTFPVINEIMANPTGSDTGKEWIELYNPSDSAINLDGWELKDKTGPHALNGLSMGAKGFLVIFPAFSLNNTDEMITLTNKTGYEDIVSYAESSEGMSIERVNYRCNGFLPHVHSHTQGLVNLNYDEKFCDPSNEIPEAEAPKIFLNEIMPDPEGSDAGNEWTELYNPNDFEVNLKDWQIEVGSKKQMIDETVIKSKGFYVVTMKVSLTNTSAEISLAAPDKKISDSFQYSETETGMSWARKIDGEGEWMILEPTKGETNISVLQVEEAVVEASIGEVKSSAEINLNLSMPVYYKLPVKEVLSEVNQIKTLDVNEAGFGAMFAAEIIIYLTMILRKEELLSLWNLLKKYLQF